MNPALKSRDRAVSWLAVADLPTVRQPLPPALAPRARRARLRAVLGLVTVLLLGLGLLGRGLLDDTMTRVRGAAMPVAGAATAGATPTASGSTKLGDNPLLAPGVSLAASTCRLPAFGRGAQQLTSFLTAQLGCLDAVWRPALRAAGLPFSPTRLTLSSDPGACKSAAETERPTAFYCGTDNMLHMPVDSVLADTGGDLAVVIAVLAHEYGHHVQDLSGILAAEARGEQRVGHGTADGLELSRRLELQANCFAGMFLASVSGRGSVTRAIAADGVDSFAAGGAESSHGTNSHQGSWADRGYRGDTTAACNTWTAAAQDVS